MEYKKLDKKVKWVWRIERLIGFMICAAFALAGWFIIKNLPDIPIIKWIYTGIVAVIIIPVILSFVIYPALEYRQWMYFINEERIEIKHGIFFIRTIVIPVLRIQHVQISEGPVYRAFGLAKVGIFTAGGHFVIVGLPKATAEEICDYLKKKVHTKLKSELDRREG